MIASTEHVHLDIEADEHSAVAGHATGDSPAAAAYFQHHGMARDTWDHEVVDTFANRRLVTPLVTDALQIRLTLSLGNCRGLNRRPTIV